jgi:hypothetical protein
MSPPPWSHSVDAGCMRGILSKAVGITTNIAVNLVASATSCTKGSRCRTGGSPVGYGPMVRARGPRTPVQFCQPRHRAIHWHNRACLSGVESFVTDATIRHRTASAVRYPTGFLLAIRPISVSGEAPRCSPSRGNRLSRGQTVHVMAKYVWKTET